jgi:hypothetical protein
MSKLEDVLIFGVIAGGAVAAYYIYEQSLKVAADIKKIANTVQAGGEQVIEGFTNIQNIIPMSNPNPTAKDVVTLMTNVKPDEYLSSMDKIVLQGIYLL